MLCLVVFHRYSGNVLLPTFEKLKRDISPRLFIDKPVTVTMWVGSSGAQSPAHHDLAFNVYIQLFGHKRFRLFPHDSVLNLCVHGRYHMHARQSRYVDIESGEIVNTASGTTTSGFDENADTERLQYIRNACKTECLDGYEVDLEPGNVLFIPPFWYHEVCMSLFKPLSVRPSIPYTTLLCACPYIVYIAGCEYS
jgi:hypothetical protein